VEERGYAGKEKEQEKEDPPAVSERIG